MPSIPWFDVKLYVSVIHPTAGISVLYDQRQTSLVEVEPPWALYYVQFSQVQIKGI